MRNVHPTRLRGRLPREDGSTTYECNSEGSVQTQRIARDSRMELRGITKIYPAVRANDGIDLKVAPGSIHAVVGENGAGKSTLMKIAFGMVRPDRGTMLWNGH